MRPTAGVRGSLLLLTAGLVAWGAQVEAASEAAVARDLLGCWRTQLVLQTLRDGKEHKVNSGCTIDFGAAEFETACRGPDGTSKRTRYAYRVDRPGHYVATMTRSATLEQLLPPREAAYRVDGDWLVVEVKPPAGDPKDPPRPAKIETLLVRAGPAAGGRGCDPLPPSQVRVGRSPQSSVVLSPPPGLAPVLEDSFQLFAVAPLLGSNFLVGIFVPAGEVAVAEHDLQDASLFVVVTDDTRAGVRPTRPNDFPEFKQRLRHELANMMVTCEQEHAICFDRDPERTSRHVTTAFTNVKGRVILAHVVVPPGQTEVAHRTALTVIERLLADNP